MEGDPRNMGILYFAITADYTDTYSSFLLGVLRICMAEVQLRAAYIKNK